MYTVLTVVVVYLQYSLSYICSTAVGLYQFSQRLLYKQVAQLSQRDRVAGWVSYGKKWKTGTGRQYFTDIIGLPSSTVT